MKVFFRQERNKNLYLLVAILIHNLTYPLSAGSGIQPILFQAWFAFMFVIGVFLLTQHQLRRVLITISGVLTFVMGVVETYLPGTLALPLLYACIIVYVSTMLVVLAQYVFDAKHILLGVVIAASSLYLVIGILFSSFYGLIEYFEPGSFAIASGVPVTWQRLLYFSYITLTTVGYGDITPVKFYAQSFASFEAVTGVLFTVILLSRLVSLYVMEQSNDMERDVIPPL